MKQFYFIIALLFMSFLSLAQAPQKMSYQAVIRNNTGTLITSTTVGMRLSILSGSATGSAVYVETQTPTTNSNGLVSLEFGSGTVISGNFAGINWALGPYFIKTETDPTGGTSYSIIGTSEFMSVPYALYSLNSVPGPQGIQGATGPAGTTGQDIYEVYGTGQISIGAATTSYVLIPGLTQTITVPAACKVFVSTDGGIQSTGATNATSSVVDIAIFVDGLSSTSAGMRRLAISNGSLAQLVMNWSMAHTYTLSAGSHTFQVGAVGGAGGTSNANVSSGSAPQLQGVLTVMIIKQ